MLGRQKVLEIIDSGSLKMMMNVGTEFVNMFEKPWWMCDIEAVSGPVGIVVAKTPCSGSVEDMLVCSRVSLSDYFALYLRSL